MDFAEELRASLQDFLTGGAIEIRENGGRLTSNMPLSWEVRRAATKPLLHLWSENCNVTRRVIAIADQSDDRISLAVERFGRSKPDRLEIIRLNYLKNPKEIWRMDFCEQLRRILAGQFADESVDRLSIAPHLEHSLSRAYARGISRHGAFFTAFLAVRDGETEDAIESSLTYALLVRSRTTDGWPQRLVNAAFDPSQGEVRGFGAPGGCIGPAHRDADLRAGSKKGDTRAG
jgi:hypothetical protein